MSYHVRDVLESAHDTAPAPHTTADDIIASAKRIRARRRIAAATGSAAACLAIVVAAGGLSTQGAGSKPTPGIPVAGAPAAAWPREVKPLLTLPDGFSTVLAEYRVGPYRVGPVAQVTENFQELPVHRDGLTWPDDSGRTYPLTTAMITVYRPGVFRPDRLGIHEPRVKFGNDVPVTVAGRPGIARTMTELPAGRPGKKSDTFRGTALAWQYAPDAWATYLPRMQQNETTEDALRIASAMVTGPARPLRTPYRLGELPEGWRIAAVAQTPESMSNAVSEVYLRKGSVPDDARADRVDLGQQGVPIIVVKGDPKDRSIRGRDGLHCAAQHAVCTLIAGDYFIDVDARLAPGLTAADIRRLVLGMRFKDFADQDTWVPADR